MRRQRYYIINTVKSKDQKFQIAFSRAEQIPPAVIFFQQIWVYDYFLLIVRLTELMIVQFNYLFF